MSTQLKYAHSTAFSQLTLGRQLTG